MGLWIEGFAVIRTARPVALAVDLLAEWLGSRL